MKIGGTDPAASSYRNPLNLSRIIPNVKFQVSFSNCKNSLSLLKLDFSPTWNSGRYRDNGILKTCLLPRLCCVTAYRTVITTVAKPVQRSHQEAALATRGRKRTNQKLHPNKCFQRLEILAPHTLVGKGYMGLLSGQQSRCLVTY